MRKPIINGTRIWERHVERTCSILLRALDSLQPESGAESEDELNRKLYFLLLEANRSAIGSRLGAFNWAPVYEGSNLPSAEDSSRVDRESKRPDFQWTCIDHSASDPKRGVRTFVIECKRLGAPLRRDWLFNVNYIRHGVSRFLTQEHSYACDDPEGAMVGYVQSMDFVEILAEVNTTAAAEGIPTIPEPNEGWNKDGTSRLAHMLMRAYGSSPFRLIHFWVDLRNRSFEQLSSQGETSSTTETQGALGGKHC